MTRGTLIVSVWVGRRARIGHYPGATHERVDYNRGVRISASSITVTNCSGIVPMCDMILSRSRARIRWHIATLSVARPPAPAGTRTHVGQPARARLLVKGITTTVRHDPARVSSWRIKTGWGNACSPPLGSPKSARYTSPRRSMAAIVPCQWPQAGAHRHQDQHLPVSGLHLHPWRTNARGWPDRSQLQ